MATHSFRSKFTRAAEHLDALTVEVRDFLNDDPCRLVREPKTDARGYVVKAKVLREPPASLASLIGDCVQNLRSSLDHLVFQLSGISPADETEGWVKSIQFPIFDDEAEFGARGGLHNIRKLPQQAQAVVKALQPYNEWGQKLAHPLWRLAQFSNIDKHRRLSVVSHTSDLSYYYGGRVPSWGTATLRGGPVKEGTVVADITFNSEEAEQMDVELEYVTGITIREPTVVVWDDEFLPDFLRDIASYIEGRVFPPLGSFL